MCQQVVLTDEALGALFALERRSVLVTIHVTAQIILVAELSRTFRALERLVLHFMLFDVLDQGLLGFELLTATLAWELAFLVDPLVVLSEAALPGKEASTLRALEVASLDHAWPGRFAHGASLRFVLR